MDKKDQITTGFLKIYTNKFDTDTIFILDLKNRSISNLSAIVQCPNLMYLDLANNRLKDIGPLVNCKRLQFLKVSNNAITSLDCCKELIDLILLDASGNNIKNLKSIQALQHCKKLVNLSLQGMNGSSKNPCCDESGYREEVLKLVPKIRRLDGVKKADKPFEDLGDIGGNVKKINFRLDVDTQHWYTDGYPQVNSKSSCIKPEDKGLDLQLATCNDLVAKIEKQIAGFAK